MEIANDTAVYIHYTLRDDNGQVLDSSEGREPLGYLHGHGNIIPGLESELTGKQPGDSLEVKITPDQAYGERDENLIQKLPMNAFQGVDKVEPGMQFQAQTEGGTRIISVQDVQDDEVTIDANHPLAGETLHFAVEVSDVRGATNEELEHGHVHGPGGTEHDED